MSVNSSVTVPVASGGVGAIGSGMEERELRPNGMPILRTVTGSCNNGGTAMQWQ